MIESVTKTADGFTVIRDGQMIYVPDDPQNVDRQDVAAWVRSDGIIVDEIPAEPVDPPVDQSATIALLQATIASLSQQVGLNAVKTYKADVRRRMTSDENDTFTDALESASSLLRGLWYDVQYLDHAAPEFDDFKAAMAAAFTPERSEEILAPSS